MPVSYPKIRLFVEASLHRGATICLTGDQAHYLLNVMRLSEGEPLALFNGRDGEWRAVLRPVGKKKADCMVMERLKPHYTPPDIWYVFAPIKHGRIDFIAQKATELGAKALVPVMTARTIANRVNAERLLANAIEATEQCERMDVPKVHDAVPFSRFLAEWPKERTLLYGDETGHGLPPQELFTALPKSTRAWGVLVGPEGGFSPDELEKLRMLSFAHAISLGPRVMRADTAGLAALACLQAWRGDWNHQPRFETGKETGDEHA